ncbi:MAG: diguanylate cyclase [Myxococcota bacterium]|nr:diguanylate cyclase [Myxococcota bacterium]
MSSSARPPILSGLAVHFGALILVLSLLSSGVITWISVRGIESFLERRIERRFPEALFSARERVDVWYGQRELDVASFANNRILTEALASPKRADRRAEAGDYLGYVLGRFPQYAALVVLDGEGEVWVQVGEGAELPTSVRAALATTERTAVSPIVELEGRSFQLVSAPLPSSRATLHALLRLDAMGTLLADGANNERSALALVDVDGNAIAGTDPPPLDELPGDGRGTPAIVHHAGERTIASALPLERFGWKLVIHEPYDVAFAPVGNAVRRAWTGNLAVVIAAGLLAFGLGALRARPILALAEGARRLAAGESGVTVPVSRAGDEVQLLARTFNDMASRLAAGRLELEMRNHELEAANEVLEQLSITDGLTKLHNHRYFQDQFERESRRADRTREPLALILADIDDFKRLNDSLGHAIGDEMLTQVAEEMCAVVRTTDVLARYGGEEFAVLAPATDLAGALALAEKVRLAVSRASVTVADEPEPVSVTTSVGVSLYCGDRRECFERADRALYAAKQSGKDCVRSSEEESAG